MTTQGSGDSIGARHLPLREQVRDELRDRITSGAFEPGRHIIERDIAAELGVSRVPVREALRLLESDGFVQVVPRRGVMVTKLSHKDVEELFDVREALEVLACRRAAQRATPEDLRGLRQMLDNALLAVERGNSAAIGQANAEFHDEIVELAHNDLLASILAPLRSRLHWLFRQNDNPLRLWHEHEDLYRAIESGDGDAAAAHAVEHVRTNRELVLHLLFGDLPA